MLDDGESSSSLISSLPSLPAAGSVGSFAECVAGTLARSSVRSSFSVWWCFHGWLVWEERRWCDADSSAGLVWPEVCPGSWVTEMISESFVSYQLLYCEKYIEIFISICLLCMSGCQSWSSRYVFLGSAVSCWLHVVCSASSLNTLYWHWAVAVLLCHGCILLCILPQRKRCTWRQHK